MPIKAVRCACMAGLLSCMAAAGAAGPGLATAAPPLTITAAEAPAMPYDAGALRVVVPSARTGGTYSLLELQEQAPYRTPPHVHPELDESFYVLEGTLALEMDGRSYALPAGSWVHIPRGTVHAQGSADGGQVRLLTRLSPGGFEQFFLDRVSWPGPSVANILISSSACSRYVRRYPHGWGRRHRGGMRRSVRTADLPAVERTGWKMLQGPPPSLSFRPKGEALFNGAAVKSGADCRSPSR